MFRSALLAAWCFLAGLALPSKALAHPFSASSMKVAVDGARVHVLFALDGPTLVAVLAGEMGGDPRSVTPERILAARDSVVSYLDAKLAVEADGAECVAGEVRDFHVTSGGRSVRLLRDWLCKSAPRQVAIDTTLLMEDEGGHRILVFAHVGPAVFEFEITREKRTARFDASGARGAAPVDFGREVRGAATPAVLPDAGGAKPGERQAVGSGAFAYVRRFFVEGIWHILIGFDHVLFVVALVLAVRTTRELLLVVTSFTVAHSITLALGALGVIAPPSGVVESIIALSIVYVGVENVVREAPRARHAVTFGFGLVHGFGFSGVLRDLGIGQGGGLVPGLVGFNLGVEVGQLALVLPCFPLLAWLRRARPETHRRVTVATGGAVAAVASVWFVERATGATLISS